VPLSDVRAHLQAALGSAYTIERELGGGGMSRVFVATETRLRRSVVVKVMSPELAADVSGERFEREIQLAEGLLEKYHLGQAPGLGCWPLKGAIQRRVEEHVRRGELSYFVPR
jgi:serine/threonine protein kinase